MYIVYQKRSDGTLSFRRGYWYLKSGGKMFALSSLSQWEKRSPLKFEMRTRTSRGITVGMMTNQAGT
jgi:hypothetical protein